MEKGGVVEGKTRKRQNIIEFRREGNLGREDPVEVELQDASAQKIAWKKEELWKGGRGEDKT